MRQIKITCLAVVLLAAACAKSNYLTVGETATVQDEDGMYLRTAPSTSAPKVLIVPNGKQVYVIAEGKPEKLFDIKSKWYRVSYGRYEGWMWGGLARPARRSSESGGMKIQPGEYSAQGEYAQSLTIDCDKSFRVCGGDACAAGCDYGIIVGSKFRTTHGEHKCCGQCTNGLNTEIHRNVSEVSADQFMQGYVLETKARCL